MILDKQKLDLIISVLISNALKYTTEGSVKISARIIKLRLNTKIIIDISDTGIGIN